MTPEQRAGEQKRLDALCQWREKPTDDPSCKVRPDPATRMCPRHTFLATLREQERNRKAAAKDAVASVPAHLQTRGWLLRRGYHFLTQATCTGCGKPIEFWNTHKGNRAPYDPMPSDESHATSHFATCRMASRFKRAG